MKRRIGIRDVAKTAGVSITTVSRALNGYSDVSEETRNRIMKIAAELNYTPNINARALGGIPETTIGLLVSDLQPSDYSNMAIGMITGVYEICAKHGCEFALLATDVERQSKQNFLQLCRKKNIDGLVVTGLRTNDVYYKDIIKGDIPSALIDINTNGKNLCSISIDNEKASDNAVKYLIELGHQHIGMINGEIVAEVSKERFSGYAKALKDAHINLNEQYVKYSDFKEEKAYEDVLLLLTRHKQITALFCASDIMAIGAIRAIEELGLRVPEDISVIGFDDIPVSKYINGGLTTIGQDPYKMGYMAGEAVYGLINKEDVFPKLIVPHEFKVRKTTGKSEKKY